MIEHRPRRILLVDDDASLLVVLAEQLSEDGFEVATARDGQEALRLARDASFKQEQTKPFTQLVLCQCALAQKDLETLAICADRLKSVAPHEMGAQYFAAIADATRGRTEDAERELEAAHAQGLPDRVYNEAAGLTLSVWYPAGPRIELEPIGPRERLKPGESASFTEEWWLLSHPFPKKGKQLDLKALAEQVEKQTAKTK